jgi:very-short-patch-repair endonuclease
MSPRECDASIVKLHNHPNLLYRRRELRSSLTSAEATLWKQLQRRQLFGWKFRRQHSVGRFVLDFYCPDARLAVELDGSPHDSEAGQRRDVERDEFLVTHGIRVVRFENRDVITNLEGVLAEITRVIEGNNHPAA